MKLKLEIRETIRQAVLILAIAFAVSVFGNMVRNEGLPWLAEELKTADTGDGDWITKTGFGIMIIDLAQAKELHDNQVVFVDARPSEQFNKSHIAGALPNINFRELIFWLDQRQTRLEPVVLYCDGNDCQLSEELAYDLEAEGFLSLYVFSGGWDDWTRAGYPVEQ